MMPNRSPNSRLIGNDLFNEIAKGLSRQKYFALIGPRKMGKGLILDQVTELFSERVKRETLHIAHR